VVAPKLTKPKGKDLLALRVTVSGTKGGKRATRQFDLIDRYGCDALRFTLAALASPGRDIKLAESRVESSRNFATKLWNAARYAEMYDCAPQAGFDPAACRLTENRWIAGATADCTAAVTRALETYRFDEAASRLYQFVWGTFCAIFPASSLAFASASPCFTIYWTSFACRPSSADNSRPVSIMSAMVWYPTIR